MEIKNTLTSQASRDFGFKKKIQLVNDDIYLSTTEDDSIYLVYQSKTAKEFNQSHIKLLTEIIEKNIKFIGLCIENFIIKNSYLKSILNMTKKLGILHFAFVACQIRNQDIIDIAYLVKDNKFIQTLNLTRNDLDTNAYDFLLNAARSNSNLKKLILDENKISAIKFRYLYSFYKQSKCDNLIGLS